MKKTTCPSYQDSFEHGCCGLPSLQLSSSVCLRRWCKGQHCCLPSNRSGFDSRPTHSVQFILLLYACIVESNIDSPRSWIIQLFPILCAMKKICPSCMLTTVTTVCLLKIYPKEKKLKNKTKPIAEYPELILFCVTSLVLLPISIHC